MYDSSISVKILLPCLMIIFSLRYMLLLQQLLHANEIVKSYFFKRAANSVKTHLVVSMILLVWVIFQRVAVYGEVRFYEAAEVNF